MYRIPSFNRSSDITPPCIESCVCNGNADYTSQSLEGVSLRREKRRELKVYHWHPKKKRKEKQTNKQQSCSCICNAGNNEISGRSIHSMSEFMVVWRSSIYIYIHTYTYESWFTKNLDESWVEWILVKKNRTSCCMIMIYDYEWRRRKQIIPLQN